MKANRCPYCSDDREVSRAWIVNALRSVSDTTARLVGVSAAASRDSSLTVHVSLDGWQVATFKAPIRYCPMCGRRLVDDGER